MTLDRILHQEIRDLELWLPREKEESIYKRDLKKRIDIKQLGFRKYEKSQC